MAQTYTSLKLTIAKRAPDKARLRIYGDIVEASALDVVVQLDSLPANVKEIEVRINSFGGSVSAGLAIYNSLKQHPAKKCVYVDGVAMSIATVIAMAGDKVYIPAAALFMVHAPWSGAQGNAVELRKSAASLDQFAEAMLAAYSGRIPADVIKAMLSDGEDHYFTGSEAVAKGFCDELIQDAENSDTMLPITAAYVDRTLAAFARGLAVIEEDTMPDVPEEQAAPAVEAAVEAVTPEAVAAPVAEVVDEVAPTEETPKVEAVVSAEPVAQVDVQAAINAAVALAVKEAQAKVLEAEAKLAQEVEAREVAAATVSARKDFGNLPGKAEQLGPALRTLAKANQGAFEVVQTVLKQVNAMLADAVTAQLAPIGSTVAESNGTAEERIEALAKAKMLKDTSLKSIYAARAAVYAENPELVTALRGEKE